MSKEANLLTALPKAIEDLTIKTVDESSAYNSSSLLSPPSSAFVSALQSPYISPRAAMAAENPPPGIPPPPPPPTQPISTVPSPPVSYSGSLSEDIPSSSYTPPPETSCFTSDDQVDPKPKSVSEPGARISFSFPVPRVSVTKGSVSPVVNTKLRSCDVFIGYHGQNANLGRFCKWLKSELELQGIACFVADRARYADTQSHEIADRVICSVAFGIVVVSSASLFNPFSIEEMRFFAQKRNLIPMFFDTEPTEIMSLLNCNSDDKERKEAIDGLMKSHEFKLEANDGDWRRCILKASNILRAKLGRKSIAEKELEGFEELPFVRNANFVGRDKEMGEIECNFFGRADCVEPECAVQVMKGGTSGQSEGFADEESDMDTNRNRSFISLEMAKSKGPTLETWPETAILCRNSLKRPKYKKSRSGKDRTPGSSVVSISGPPGVGKTELVLEFTYRYCQRYKRVLWVGGETRYLRQNILNLAMILGIDVSSDPEKERGRIRSFEEQECEAFKRLKRELFRDMPYLIIIDNLETANEWWEGKNLHDFIPRNTGGSNVIITTCLSKVMNFEQMQLQPLPMADAMILIRGKRKKDYPTEEYECLRKFDEKLGSSTFGLSVVGSLLSELAISPSALYEVINQIPFEQPSNNSTISSISDEQFCRNNPFLMKLLGFCLAVLEKATKRRDCLASRMLHVGAWFAPAQISASVLATAARNMPAAGGRLQKWTKSINPASFCCSGCPLAAQTWNTEKESALLLVKLGMARIAACQPGLWIQFHPITQIFARRREASAATKAMVLAFRKIGNPLVNSNHLWASAFLVFGFKSEPPMVQLKASETVLFIKKTALPLAITAFTTFSRCNSALELLKVCTHILEEVEKSFVSQIQDWHHGSLCWKNKKLQFSSKERVDGHVWQDVTLLKATLLEMRGKLMLRGGYFDSAEELCRTCISIRTVVLGHNHAQTLAAQETLAKVVRLRSKI